MTDPNSITAHFGPASFPGLIRALEGNGGFMRVFFDWAGADFSPLAGQEGTLEMHDGARFRVTVIEPLDLKAGGHSGELRVKLLGRG